MPRVPPNVTDEDITNFTGDISAHFHKTEGHGKNCKVEPYRRNHKEYFFAYPEDFGLSDAEWVNQSLKTCARHPAFEINFVYCEQEGSLDIYAPQKTKDVPELQQIFAKAVLYLETLADCSINKLVYNLTPLSDSEFNLQIEPESGIEVTQLRLSLKYHQKQRITFEADTKHNLQAVYDSLYEVLLILNLLI